MVKMMMMKIMMMKMMVMKMMVKMIEDLRRKCSSMNPGMAAP